MKNLLLGLIIAASVFTIVSCKHKVAEIETPTSPTETLNNYVCKLTTYDSLAILETNTKFQKWDVKASYSYLTIQEKNRSAAQTICAMNNVPKYRISVGSGYKYGYRSIWCMLN